MRPTFSSMNRRHIRDLEGSPRGRFSMRQCGCSQRYAPDRFFMMEPALDTRLLGDFSLIYADQQGQWSQRLASVTDWRRSDPLRVPLGALLHKKSYPRVGFHRCTFEKRTGILSPGKISREAMHAELRMNLFENNQVSCTIKRAQINIRNTTHLHII